MLPVTSCLGDLLDSAERLRSKITIVYDVCVVWNLALLGRLDPHQHLSTPDVGSGSGLFVVTATKAADAYGTVQPNCTQATVNWDLAQ